MKVSVIWIILLVMKGINGLLKTLLIIALLVWGLTGLFSPGSAQTTPILSVEPSTIEVPFGNRVQLELEVDNGVNVHAFDLMINYDLDRLALLTWEHGDYLSELTCTHLIRQPGVFELACNQLTQEEVDGDGVLLVLIFDTLALGLPDVTITEATFFDNTGVMTYPQRQNGVVEVTSDPTYTTTPTITRTPTQTLTPISTISPTPSPSPTSTSTITPFLSPTPEWTATESLDLEAQETEFPDQGTTAALQTVFALTETASGAGIPSDTTRTGEAGTPSPVPLEEEDDSIDKEPSQSQNLVRDLWRMTLWAVLIFIVFVILGSIIFYLWQRTKKGDEEGLLL